VDTPTLIGTGLFILGAVVWVVCAIYCYRLAPTVGRSAGLWAVLGIIFGPIALMILYVLPKHPPLAGHGRSSRKDARAAMYEKPHKD
jgi:hypothetical protein